MKWWYYEIYICWNELTFGVFLHFPGKENLWLEKEEPGIGEVQVCAGL